MVSGTTHTKVVPVAWIAHTKDAVVTTQLGVATITYVRER